MKLYPPYIEGKIPAFVKAGTITLTVPFQLNPLVGKNDFDKLVLVLKSISGEQLRGIIEATPYYVYEENNQDIHMGYADFKIPVADKDWTTPINIGQYYKVQVAFKNGDSIGYYSSTGITKCIAEPTCSIENLQQNEVVANPFTFVGVYNYGSEEDNEKLYSCRFDVYDDSYNLYDTSGEIIHSANKTDGKDAWELTKNLQPDQIYYIQYNYLTQNNYEGSTPKYPIMEGLFQPKNNWYNSFEFNVDPKNESGKNTIIINTTSPTSLVNGTYKIVRTSSETNYEDWVDMFEFSIANQAIDSKSPITWNDYFLTHGVKYKYALQRFNSKGVRLEREFETKQPILADFEDMFLFDGKRQLRLAFNPKVSSFKTTILENKVDTLGGSYPFFYRNGNIAYKDFPISALISINMDENFDFLDEEKVKQLLNLKDGVPAPGRPSTPTNLSEAISRTTTLTTDNMRVEREFKTEVLNWLNNGKFKLFRSPAEGNFLVRLMNVNLSPIDTLGRMIHSFNANAYEVGTSDVRSLLKREEFRPEVKVINIQASKDILLESTSQDVKENTHFLSLTVVGASKPTLEYVYRNEKLEEVGEEEIPVNAVHGKFTWKDLDFLPRTDPEDPNHKAYRITIEDGEQKRAYYNYVEKLAIVQDEFEVKEPLILEFDKGNITSLKDAYYIHSIEITNFPENGNFTMFTPTKEIVFTRLPGDTNDTRIDIVNARSSLCSISSSPKNIPYKLHCYVIKGGA